MASNYKKIDHNKWHDEEFERKEFFNVLNLEGIRMMMRIKGGMVNTIPGNFKQKYRKKTLSFTCQSCKDIKKNTKPEAEKPVDTQLHVLEECEAFDDIRQAVDIKSDTGIVEYFKEIVKRRIQAGEE